MQKDFKAYFNNYNLLVYLTINLCGNRNICE